MREHIRKQVGKVSLRSKAATIGVSAAYLSDVLTGKRKISDAMARRFGYRKLEPVGPRYVKLKGREK